MQLKEALEAHARGGSKGIRRTKWVTGTWVKVNDYGCQDDLITVDGHRGYNPNLSDFFADDWETFG